MKYEREENNKSWKLYHDIYIYMLHNINITTHSETFRKSYETKICIVRFQKIH